MVAVSWREDKYESLALEEGEIGTGPPLTYCANELAVLVDDIRRAGGGPVVIEGTNGALDGRLMAEGVEVYRADLSILPKRTRFGGVASIEILQVARRDPSRLTLLQRHRGTQTGREDLLRRDIESSARADVEMAASGRLLERGSQDHGQVALTFDDGPLPPYTPQILEILDFYQIPATFFCVGINAAAWPEVVQQTVMHGHAVGNHTWSHPFLTELSVREMREQVKRTAELLACDSARRLFRPPYGCRSPAVMGALTAEKQCVTLWDVAPDDWALRTADAIADDVLKDADPGSIVLLHDGGGDRSATVASLPRIIEGLMERGLTFVRVDEMNWSQKSLGSA